MTACLVGLPLAKVSELIAQQPGCAELEVRVLESAPPFLPKFRRPIWGEQRVLRARSQGSILELIVARELLGEEILHKETASA